MDTPSYARIIELREVWETAFRRFWVPAEASSFLDELLDVAELCKELQKYSQQSHSELSQDVLNQFWVFISRHESLVKQANLQVTENHREDAGELLEEEILRKAASNLFQSVNWATEKNEIAVLREKLQELLSLKRSEDRTRLENRSFNFGHIVGESKNSYAELLASDVKLLCCYLELISLIILNINRILNPIGLVDGQLDDSILRQLSQVLLPPQPPFRHKYVSIGSSQSKPYNEQSSPILDLSQDSAHIIISRRLENLSMRITTPISTIEPNYRHGVTDDTVFVFTIKILQALRKIIGEEIGHRFSFEIQDEVRPNLKDEASHSHAWVMSNELDAWYMLQERTHRKLLHYDKRLEFPQISPIQSSGLHSSSNLHSVPGFSVNNEASYLVSSTPRLTARSLVPAPILGSKSSFESSAYYSYSSRSSSHYTSSTAPSSTYNPFRAKTSSLYPSLPTRPLSRHPLALVSSPNSRTQLETFDPGILVDISFSSFSIRSRITQLHRSQHGEVQIITTFSEDERVKINLSIDEIEPTTTGAFLKPLFQVGFLDNVQKYQIRFEGNLHRITVARIERGTQEILRIPVVYTFQNKKDFLSFQELLLSKEVLDCANIRTIRTIREKAVECDLGTIWLLRDPTRGARSIFYFRSFKAWGEQPGFVEIPVISFKSVQEPPRESKKLVLAVNRQPTVSPGVNEDFPRLSLEVEFCKSKDCHRFWSLLNDAQFLDTSSTMNLGSLPDDGIRASNNIEIESRSKLPINTTYDHPQSPALVRSLISENEVWDQSQAREGNDSSGKNLLETLQEDVPLEIQLVSLQESISSGDVTAIQSILEKYFDAVAKNDFAWLQELKEMGYPESDMAELLLNSEKDSPWIYFEPKASTDQLMIMPEYHQPACVHRCLPGLQDTPSLTDVKDSTKASIIEPSRPSWSTDEDSGSVFIEELCGLAGICPNTRDIEKWMGHVLFKKDGPKMTASVTYDMRPQSEDDQDVVSKDIHKGKAIESSSVDHYDKIFRNTVEILKKFCAAVGYGQRNGICCESFTILSKASFSRTIPEIEIRRLDLKLVVALTNLLQNEHQELESKPISQVSDVIIRKIKDLAKAIIQVFLGRLPLLIPWANIIDQMLNNFALAVQLLTVGLSYYTRAHVGTFHPFFMDTPIHDIHLFGSLHSQRKYPEASARLYQLTCMDGMIQKPVMVFSGYMYWLDELLQSPHDLLTSSIDLVDTWGPGQFIGNQAESSSGDLSITAILIGGGMIQATDSDAAVLHWSRELTPIRFTSESRPWSVKTKLRIAGGVKVNNACTIDLKKEWPFFAEMLENLGTYGAYWDFTEFQAGIALSGQQFAGGQLQFNKTWTWHDGNSWKQYFLGLMAQDMPFEELDRPWGLQVSYCTGVSRRVPLRVLLADVIPIFVQSLSLPPAWTVLKDHGIIAAFEGTNLRDWLASLNLLPDSQQLVVLVKRIVQYILLVLKDTGIDRTGKKLRIACPKDEISGKPMAMCLEVPCEKANLWARILADSKDCATFACMTSLCLESDEHKCHTTSPWHCPLLQTAVCRYRGKHDPLIPQGGAWELRDQAMYWIGKPETGLQTRVKKSPTDPSPRLYVSISTMSEKTLKRLGTMRLMSKMGKRMEHLREKQYENWIAEGVVVLADIKE